MKKLFAFFMIFMLSFLMIIPSSYAISVNDFPSVPESDKSYSYGFLYKSADAETYFYTLYESEGVFLDKVVFTDDYEETSYDGPYILEHRFVSGHAKVYQEIYKYVEGEWKFQGSYERQTKHISGVQPSNVIYSTVDIYNEDGSVFFTPTPAVVAIPLEEIMEAEMPKFQETTVGTMMILMVCGVCLIALLVVLNLFGKVSRIFRIR